jgi:hypothetical protein
MTVATRPIVATGGCQCGAVRYALHAPLENAHVCHCRMCQKAMGNFFAAFGRIDNKNLTWTRGQPSVYRSSAAVERGFCAACGTPLSYQYLAYARINLTLGSLDDPSAYPPIRQYGTENCSSFLSGLTALPGETTEQAVPPELFKRIKSLQHPDHDTDVWPPKTSTP